VVAFFEKMQDFKTKRKIGDDGVNGFKGQG
jgi:hypothetical protein